MPSVGILAAIASVALLPQLADARPRHDDGPTVRDHRSSDSAPVVRDHRGSDHERSAPVVRDHRDDRDTRSDDYATTSTYDDDSPASDPFAHPTGPTWIFEAGGFGHRFRGPALSRSGSVETFDGSMASYDLSSGAPSAGDTAAAVFDMRFLVPASEHYYAGVELGVGGLTRSPIRLMSDDALHISSRALINPNAVIGARARQGIAELGAEVAGGLRIVSTSVRPIDAFEDDPTATETAVDAVVEARVRGALWIAPHVFVGAQLGVGVLDRSDVSFGLSIGLTSRPYAQMQ